MRRQGMLVALLLLGSSCHEPEAPPVGDRASPGQPPVVAEPPVPAVDRDQLRQQIAALAAGSECAAHDWPDPQGVAPAAYMRGMALVFARAVCHPERADVAAVSAAQGAATTDALRHYEAQFRALGMANDTAGVDTLRHAYTLLIGLGMPESSGRHCVGRDRSANFSTADTAEAGLFQTSWGARRAHPALPALFAQYSDDQSACLLDVFAEGVSCSEWDARNWGEGSGRDWQILTKSCPAFATEYGAVVLRANGGSRGEFGPIRRRTAEVTPECDAMLQEVQQLIETTPGACSAL